MKTVSHIYKGFEFFKGSKYKTVSSTGYKGTAYHCGVSYNGVNLFSCGTWKGVNHMLNRKKLHSCDVQWLNGVVAMAKDAYKKHCYNNFLPEPIFYEEHLSLEKLANAHNDYIIKTLKEIL